MVSVLVLAALIVAHPAPPASGAAPASSDPPASAAPAPPAASLAAVILRVEVEGVRRTSPDYVRHSLGLAPGDPFDPAALPGLEQRLLNRKIFRAARITAVPEAGGVVLRVAVEEKITQLPMPFVGASRGVFTGGVVLLDANAFGAGQQALLGVLGSNRGASAFAVYRDPGVAYTRWLLSARAAAADTRRERFDGRDLLYRYRERQLELSGALGWRIDERWAVLAGWAERRGEARASSGYAAPPRLGAVHGPLVEVELDAADQRGYVVHGVIARAELRQGVRLAPQDRRVGQATITATASGEGLRDHAVSLLVRMDGVRGDAVLDAVRLGGLPGSRGFRSQGLWAEAAAGAALEYQIPVWRPRWGVLTAAGFCDAGVVRWRGEVTRYVAPGTGIRLWLRNVAAPLLGLDLAWATGQPAPAFSVQLGLRR